jgi:signal transduction histidine kinase/ligand-binding sensor domain-containing protein/AraC-like DNA-binding protein
MWFGTFDGLNRWDGHTFRVFKWDPGDSNSISANYIRTLLQASSGKIWVGTNDGLNCYNPQTEKFTRIQIAEYNSSSQHDNIIHDLYEDTSGNLWIAASPGIYYYDVNADKLSSFIPNFGNREQERSYNYILCICPYQNDKLLLGTTAGLLIFDTKSANFKPVPCPYEIPRTPVVNWWWPINSIQIDRRGKIWIGMSSGGLVKFDIESNKARLFRRDADDFSNYSAYNVSALLETEDSTIWVGSHFDGLNRLAPGAEQFTVYRYNPVDDKNISSSKISTLYEDRQGNLWIGTRDQGINLIPKWRKGFERITLDPTSSLNSDNCEITDICEDHSGNIWISTYGSDLTVLDPVNGKKTKYIRDFNDPKSISQPTLRTVYCDRSGTIWIGAIILNRFDTKTNGFIKYYNDSNNPQSHAFAPIFAIYEDRDGKLWLGTAGEGLERLDTNTEIFHHYRNDPENPNSLSYNVVLSIFQDHLGVLWIGTGIGLCRLNIDDSGNEQFARYQHSSTDPYYIRRNVIFDIFEDSNMRLWLGTAAGLAYYDREKDSIQVLNDKNGFPEDCYVYVIKEDDHNNLWLRTNEGLAKFDQSQGKFKIYNEQDGLINCRSIFNGFQAFYQSKNGMMYYGTANSLIRFNPDSIKENTDVPNVRLTNFRVHNDPILIGQNSILKKSITVTDTIYLTYEQNNISFDFAALDFTAPRKNQYAFIMEGVDKNWIYSENRSRATYTNLDPGDYLFRVKGSNNDGLWNEKGTSVHLIISPPWWRTTWAYSGYIFIFVFTLFALRTYDQKRQRLKQALILEQEHAEKLEEVDQMKSRFFANISHEFRTPITLILGPVEQMLSGSFRGNLKEQYQIILRNGRRLLRLINQLLDLSKLESGGMNLKFDQYNIVELVRNFVQCFESLAKRKNIRLEFYAEKKSLLLYVDRDKIEQILNNLLSNAFKFTSKGGRIAIEIVVKKNSAALLKQEEKKPEILSKNVKTEWLKISISDTGIGIPPDRLDKIFDRFYQIDSSQKRAYEGSGIGLALTRELVELHHGILKVESESGKGSTFMVYLPFGKEHFSKDEMNVTEDHSRMTDKTVVEDISEDIALQVAPEADFKYADNKNSGLPLLLIIEDNADMRSYLSGHLVGEFRIIEAKDGQDGLHKAVHESPDLIISDVMMPRMDGFELCHQIKTDTRTSHIPLILLTARADSSHKMEGLETGADDYLVKPFIAEELMVRSKNLIEQRLRLKERFSREIHFPFKDLSTNKADDLFIQKLMTIVHDNLSEFGFNIDNLSDKLGMSRMSLHRKIQGLFGQSPGNFLRTIRLKRGAELLKNKTGNISEIAYEVGFENPNTFSRNFRRQFGISPSEFNKQLH